jgi:putative NADH-flavin reductase
MRILVMGGSSGIGLETVKTGLLAGHDMVAFSRSAGEMDLSNDRLTKHSGNALEASDVTAALDGVDLVIQALGVPLNVDTVRGPVTLFSEATEVLVPAMKSAGVERVIAVTGIGSGDSFSAINPVHKAGLKLVLGRAYEDKDKQEQMLRTSGLDWTIVRPGVLTDGPKSGTVKALRGRDEWKVGFISRADVGQFLIGEAEQAAFSGETPALVSDAKPTDKVRDLFAQVTP